MSHPDQSPQRKDRDERSSYGIAVVAGLFIVLALAALPFLPLLLSTCEEVLFRTNHVEEFCKRIGIHDELGTLYYAVFSWFR